MSVIDELFKRGREMRSAVLGRAHVERSDKRATPFNADFHSYITKNVWGDIWSRPGLDRKTRSMLTIAMLVALGKVDELKLHIRATRNTGVSRDEVKEIFLHAMIYAGVPATNTAFLVAAEVYDEMDKDAAS